MIRGKLKRKKRLEEVLFEEGRRAEREYWYKVEGIPYDTCTDDQIDAYLRSFVALIANSREGLIYARKRAVRVSLGTHVFERVVPEFFVRVERPIFTIFDVMPVQNPLNSRPIVVEYRFPRYLKLADGSFARVLVAYRYGLTLPEIFTYYGLQYADEMFFLWRHIDKSLAVAKIDRILSRKIQSERVEDADYVSKLRSLAERLGAGEDLIAFHLLYVVKSKDPTTLKEKINELKDRLRGCGVELDDPSVYQDELYYCKTNFLKFFGLETHYTDTESIKAFFPFVGQGHYDDGGVFIGFTLTGHVVYLDIFKRYNYNFVVLGASGSGKSVFVKTFLRRLVHQSRIAVSGIDPENEYVHLSQEFLAVGINVSKGAGLDPIKMLVKGYLELGQVVDLLTETYGIEAKHKGELSYLLKKYCESEREPSIFDFVDCLPPYLKKPLQMVYTQEHSSIYEGELPEIGDGGVIFGIGNIKTKVLKVLTSALLSAYYFNRLYQSSRGHVFFVDEGWLFKDYPHVLRLFEDLARRGRKRRIGFVFATQRVEELVKEEEGRSIIEQAATALILKHSREGIESVKDIYKLTDKEARFLVNANVGQGILKVEDRRYIIQVTPTSYELRKFST